jgi:hypothetical protein
MPVAQNHPVLKAVYEETCRRIHNRQIPTELIYSSRTLYRSIDLQYVKINSNGIFPKQYANQALVIRDQGLDTNRFSGQSFDPNIPAQGGLYCSTQQQAQINELLHYARSQSLIPRDRKTGFPRSDATLSRKCIVKIRMMSSVLAADLSPHNMDARRFVEDIGGAPGVQSAFRISKAAQRPMWEVPCDGQDCSVARGIGLAVANSPYLGALQVETVRPSARSAEETGDNLVFFGSNGQQIPGLWIEEAYLFPVKGDLQVYPVQFG